MYDLIDREELTALINKVLLDIQNGKIELHEQMLEQLVINITCLPSADTERHAHWINTTAPDEQKIHSIFQCSNCYNSIEFGEPLSNPFEFDEADYCYCGKCGCRMDEVVGNEKRE